MINCRTLIITCITPLDRKVPSNNSPPGSPETHISLASPAETGPGSSCGGDFQPLQNKKILRCFPDWVYCSVRHTPTGPQSPKMREVRKENVEEVLSKQSRHWREEDLKKYPRTVMPPREPHTFFKKGFRRHPWRTHSDPRWLSP